MIIYKIIFLILIIIINYGFTFLIYKIGYDYSYSDGVSQTDYICTSSWVDDFGYLKNGITGLIYTPLVNCEYDISMTVIFFNLAILFMANFVLLKDSLLSKFEIFLVILSESFIIYTSIYPSKELITFFFVIIFLKYKKLLYLIPLAMMRPSYAVLGLVKFVKLRTAAIISIVLSIFTVPVYMDLVGIDPRFNFINSYLEKVADYGYSYEQISDISFHVYKLFVTFFGYRHLLNPENLYSIYSIIYFILGIFIFIFITYKVFTKINVVWMPILLLGSIFIYPFAHSRFIYPVFPIILLYIFTKKDDLR